MPQASYKGQLEAMLVAHVAPLFASPHGHLRAKAAWLSGVYADIQFAAGQSSFEIEKNNQLHLFTSLLLVDCKSTARDKVSSRGHLWSVSSSVTVVSKLRRLLLIEPR